MFELIFQTQRAVASAIVLQIFRAIREAGLEMSPQRRFFTVLGSPSGKMPYRLVEHFHWRIFGIITFVVGKREIASADLNKDLVEIRLHDKRLEPLMRRIMPAAVSARPQFKLKVGE